MYVMIFKEILESKSILVPELSMKRNCSFYQITFRIRFFYKSFHDFISELSILKSIVSEFRNFDLVLLLQPFGFSETWRGCSKPEDGT